MPRHLPARATAALLLALAPVGAQAAQVCAWLVETTGPDDLHDVELWLEADQDLDLYYKMAGEGFTTDGSRMYSPGSGTFSLRRGVAARPWGFGATLSGPGDIDIVAELHAPPKDIFSDEPSPLLASFTFRRHVPEGEEKAPPVLATRQCAALAPG